MKRIGRTGVGAAGTKGVGLVALCAVVLVLTACGASHHTAPRRTASNQHVSVAQQFDNERLHKSFLNNMPWLDTYLKLTTEQKLLKDPTADDSYVTGVSCVNANPQGVSGNGVLCEVNCSDYAAYDLALTITDNGHSYTVNSVRPAPQ